MNATYRNKTLDQWEHDLGVAALHLAEAETAIAELKALAAANRIVELSRSVVEDLMKIIGAMSENDADDLLKRGYGWQGFRAADPHDPSLYETYKALIAALEGEL